MGKASLTHVVKMSYKINIFWYIVINCYVHEIKRYILLDLKNVYAIAFIAVLVVMFKSLKKVYTS